MQVANLSSPLPPNAQWIIFFTTPDATEHFRCHGHHQQPCYSGVYLRPRNHPRHGQSINWLPTALPTPAARSTQTARFSSSSTTVRSAVRLLVISSSISDGETQLEVGAAGTGLLETIDSTSAGRYILIGNQACALKPVLTAKPVNRFCSSKL